MRTCCTKKAYLLSIALLPILTAKAQFHFGIKAGFSLSNISIKPAATGVTYNPRFARIGGFFACIPIYKKLSLRPEVLSIGKGSRAKFTNSYTDVIMLSYIDMPVNILYEISLGKKKLFAGLGPVISLLLNQKANYGMGTGDIGANVSIIYEWPIGASIGLNYTQGLKTVTADPNKSTTLQNYYFGLTAGYWF